MFKLLFGNNLNFKFLNESAHYIFCDPIYQDLNFCNWVDKFYSVLKPNGIFCVITDFHSDYRFRVYLEDVVKATFISHLVWKNEWGNHPKNKFHQCFDSILIYCKGKNYKFYPERIQVPKVTLTKGLNPSGRITKQATAWIDDCTLTTTAKERVKKADGHLISYQKPLKLFDRIILPFTDEEDIIVDPFMGSGSLAEWSKRNNRQYVGIEIDTEVFSLAMKRMNAI